MIIEPTSAAVLKKYQYEPKYLEIITIEKFKNFMKNYQISELIPFYKSEKLPPQDTHSSIT